MKSMVVVLCLLFVILDATYGSTAPFVVAHRGFSSAAPENTLPAFKMAADVGCTGIEVDLLYTKDMQLVVLHDLTLDRTTNCTGYVSNYTYAELLACDASYVDGKDFHQFRGAKIPLFSEVAQLAANYSLFVVIDFKSDLPIGQSVMQILNNQSENLIVFVSCWYPWQIDDIAANMTGYPKQLVTSGIDWSVSGFWRMLVGAGVNGFSIRFTNVTQEFMKQAHSRLLNVAVWTVNNETDMERMVSYGVDAIITDYPTLLQSVIDRQNGYNKNSDYIEFHKYTVAISAVVTFVVVLISVGLALYFYKKKGYVRV